MDPRLYHATQERLIAACGVLLGLHLDEFIDDIERAEATGPIINPTLFRDASGTLGNIKRLAIAAREVKAVAHDVLRDELARKTG